MAVYFISNQILGHYRIVKYSKSIIYGNGSHILRVLDTIDTIVNNITDGVRRCICSLLGAIDEITVREMYL